MKKMSLSLALITSLMVGCSAPKAKRLDDSSALSINNSILEHKYSFVPKDPYLSGFNWTYHIVVEKKTVDDDFIKNDLVTKTFVGGKIKCRKRKIKCRIFATNYLSFNLKLKL